MRRFLIDENPTSLQLDTSTGYEMRMFASEAEIDTLLQRFEDKTLPHDEWTHSAHLAVAALTVMRLGDGASDYLRTHIRQLNAAHGVVETPDRGYHETLTLAWVRVVAGYLSSLDDALPRAEKVNAVVSAFADKKHLLKYYSRDRIMSLDARYGFIEPDLEPLP